MEGRAKKAKIFWQIHSKQLLSILGFALVSTWLFYGVRYVLFPYQHEYREGAVLPVIRLIIEGNNPYSYEYQPVYSYVYGILNPLLCSPICRVFGLGLPQVRMMSLLYMLGSSVALFFYGNKKTITLGLNLVLVGLFLLMYQGSLSAAPDDLGVMLLIFALIYLLRKGYSLKTYAVTMLVAVLGFYAKPFYLIILGYVAADLFFFRSKKNGILYFFIGIGLFLSTLLVMNAVFPTYINNNFFHHIGDTTVFSFGHMVKQWKYYLLENALVLIAVLFVLIDRFRCKPEKAFEIDIKNFSKPFIVTGTDGGCILELGVIIISILFSFSLGGHRGAGNAEYLYLMCSPLIALFFFSNISQVKNKKTSTIVITLLVCFSAFQLPRLVARDKGLLENKRSIEMIAGLINENQKVYTAPSLVSVLMDRGMPIYESGMSEYFVTGDNPMARKIADTTMVRTLHDSYVADFNRKVLEGYFDILFINERRNWLVDVDLLPEKYELADVLLCKQSINSFYLEYWKRKR